MNGWLRNTRTKGKKIRPHPGSLPQERGTTRPRVVVDEWMNGADFGSGGYDVRQGECDRGLSWFFEQLAVDSTGGKTVTLVNHEISSRGALPIIDFRHSE